jgi:hypothetical protein
MVRWLILRMKNAKAVGYTFVSIIELILIRLGYAIESIRPNQYVSMSHPCPRFVHILSLDFRQDRRSKMKSAMAIAGLDYEFVDALHGNATNLDLVSGSQISAPSKKYLSRGSIGAILSHYALWKKLSKGEEQCIIIFEDDVVPKLQVI